MKLTNIVSVALASCVFVAPAWGEAAFPGISPAKYIRTFIVGMENIPVYTDETLATRGTAKPFKVYDSAIYPTDEIYIFEITDAWAYVSYPTNWSGRREGYIPLSAVTSNNFSHDALKFRGLWESLYKRSNGARYVDSAIYDNDTVYTVARDGDYTQVVYPARNVYKMVWLSNDEYEKRVTGNPANTIAGDPAPERYRAKFDAPYYAVDDERWAKDLSGDEHGSLCAALAIKYSYHSQSPTYPDYIKNALVHDGAVNLAVLKDFSYEYLNYHCPLHNSILAIILREIIYGKPVIIGAADGRDTHWATVVGYEGLLGREFNAADFFVLDPQDENCRTLAEFLSGKKEIVRIIF